MRNYLVAGLIGIVVGLIDITPMILQKLPKRANVSAFLQYFLISIIICFIDFPSIPWFLEGSLISLALSIPIIIITSEKDNKNKYIISSMAIILGLIIGLLKHNFIG
jgi:hypothetical protein